MTLSFRVMIFDLLAQWVRVVRKLLFLSSKIQAQLRQKYAQKTVAASDRWDGGLISYYQRLSGVLPGLKARPTISILVPVYKVKPLYLQECLNSISAQVYSNWELCLVDDGSNDESLRSIVESFHQRFPDQVRFRFETQNGGICKASQLALELATGEFIALLDHDDRLLPNALLEVARAIQLNGSSDIFYSDESRISEEGIVESTFHKPSWSPLFSLAVHYSTHLTVYRRELVIKVEGFRAGYEGSQDHDLMLRAAEQTRGPVVHIPLVLYQWRAHAQSTARSTQAKPYAASAGEKAVREACIRRGWPADVQYDQNLERYRVSFELKAAVEKVSILIPTRDAFDLIEPCLKSVFKTTSGIPFEVVIIDHQSQDQRCLRLFDEFQRSYPTQFKRIVYKGSFNFAAMNNVAARNCEGSYLLFLNNDTEVLHQSWLKEMLSIAQLPKTGAVGAKLLLDNGRIQHAGIVGLGHRIAGNAGFDRPAGCRDYYSYYQTTHETLAVTGACFLISRKKFELAGGFDEVNVPNGFGDVDLCLKLRDLGLDNVYVPHAVLRHKESPTRRASFEHYERWYMLERWGKILVADPYLNPNLERGLWYQTDFDSTFVQPTEVAFQKILQPVSR